MNIKKMNMDLYNQIHHMLIAPWPSRTLGAGPQAALPRARGADSLQRANRHGDY